MQACASLDVDIIAADLSRRLPFRFRPGPILAAVKRGVHFEVCYAAALRTEASRRNFFANASGACSTQSPSKIRATDEL
jgi:ribonuclease P/MRP protein subunit RPP1